MDLLTEREVEILNDHVDFELKQLSQGKGSEPNLRHLLSELEEHNRTKEPEKEESEWQPR